MSTKHLLTISLILPLVAVSATAQAGSTITDKSYWPNEARQSPPTHSGSSAGPYSAFAYDRAGSSLQPAASRSLTYPHQEGAFQWTPNYLSISEGENSLLSTLRGHFVRYQMLLYVLFAAATSLSVAWNWNWLTGAEVFRILASLPCTFMMLMCMKRAARRSSGE
jgi:hypothetical protein